MALIVHKRWGSLSQTKGMGMKKTIKGYRITMDVDPEWFATIAEVTSYRETGEVMHWISTEDKEFQVEFCEICNMDADEDGVIDHDEFLHEEESE